MADPATFAITAVTLLIVATVASYIPGARTAVSIRYLHCGASKSSETQKGRGVSTPALSARLSN